MNWGHKSFPEPLHSVPVKIINPTTLGMNFMSMPQEKFYSIKSGNWTDPSVWRTVSGRAGRYPGQFGTTDDVYVRHTVTLNANTAINNFFVSGTFKADNSSRIITINGSIQSSGVIDFTGSNVNIKLYGSNNLIVNFISGSSSTVTYAGNYSQNILNLIYQNLSISCTANTVNGAIRYLTADLNLNGNFTITNEVFNVGKVTAEIGGYNMSISGTTTLSGTSVLSKSGSGSVLFVGNLSMSSASNFIINFSGNPNVEFRGGITVTNSILTSISSGTGIWSFTTNNQNITFGNSTTWVIDASILIRGAISLTWATSGSTLQINNSIDGDNASSSFVNKGTVNFNSTTNAMATLGTFDCTSFVNTVGYIYSGNGTIQYTAYSSLTIGTNTTGTKSLSGTTTVSGNLVVNTSILECSTYDLSVTGTSGVNSGSASISKTGSGSLLFVGLLSWNAGGGTVMNLTGNPSVELRGGFTLVGGSPSFNSGTGTWTFTTNSQNITLSSATLTFGCNFLISGVITVTNVLSTFALVLSGTLDGNNASSTFDNRGTVSYRNATMPMATLGTLQCTAAANTFKYDMAGNQAVKGNAYSTVNFGTSGNKTLQGNCTDTARSTTGTAVLVLNGFTIVP